MLKIELGRKYVNKWGEARIPIKIDQKDINYIFYIDCVQLSDLGSMYVYNPYKNRIKISSMENWEKEKSEKLTGTQITQIEKLMFLIDTQWRELLNKGMIGLSDILIKQKFNN